MRLFYSRDKRRLQRVARSVQMWVRVCCPCSKCCFWHFVQQREKKQLQLGIRFSKLINTFNHSTQIHCANVCYRTISILFSRLAQFIWCPWKCYFLKLCFPHVSKRIWIRMQMKIPKKREKIAICKWKSLKKVIFRPKSSKYLDPKDKETLLSRTKVCSDTSSHQT